MNLRIIIKNNLAHVSYLMQFLLQGKEHLAEIGFFV